MSRNWSLTGRYCFKRYSRPMEVLRCFLGWSWKLCSNSLVPFVVLGDSVDCRRLVVFWPRWFGVFNNGFGTYRCEINSSVLGGLSQGVAPPPWAPRGGSRGWLSATPLCLGAGCSYPSFFFFFFFFEKIFFLNFFF
jgi:hypothetical protein